MHETPLKYSCGKAMKSLRTLIGVSFALSMAFWSACDQDGNCPEIVQPDISEFTNIQRQRFPYGLLNTLTFRIEKNGSVDTVIMHREKLDSGVMNIGDDFFHENDCPRAYESRWRFLHANYISEDRKERLKFSMNKSTRTLYAQWKTDSVWFRQDAITQLVGSKNDSFAHDTVHVLGKAYTPAFCGFRATRQSDSIDVCYSYDNGFILIHDKQNDQKWELVSAFEINRI